MLIKLLTFFLLPIALISGCSSKGTITNKTLEPTHKNAYSVSASSQEQQAKTVVLMTFSGGGTRAAALSYGVLKGLRDTNYDTEKGSSNLLHQVMAISSVSGGSFTAAYYGLYGEQIFDTFEQEFLYRDVSSGLINLFISPSHIFSNQTRTNSAADFYNKSLFKNHTFGDIREDGPFIIINASDLGKGVRFSFVQEYFDLLCSDLNQYPVSDAVAASSAVPLIFEPVVLKNFEHCNKHTFRNLDNKHSPHIQNTMKGLESYANKTERPYVHLVDGGITDNLGLLAFYDITQSNHSFFATLSSDVDTIVVIAVDASTQPKREIDSSIDAPSPANTINAVTDIQLHRYNDMSKHVVIEELDKWTNKDINRKTLFLDINLNNAANFSAMNKIPTNFTLDDEQVDVLIQHGYKQIVDQPLLKNIHAKN